MPRSKNNKQRIKPIKQNVESAAEKVLRNELSLREAAREYQISRSTLCRHLKKHDRDSNLPFVYSASNAVKQVFTNVQEASLVAYLMQAANMHYGLSTVEVRKLAYNYANINNIDHPASWNEAKMAGVDWLKSFKKRNSAISLRKPQATSIARSTAFNKFNVNLFFDKLEDVMKRFEFAPQNIFNMDETGISTVHVPVRVLAAKGTKQIGSMTSAERGVNVTLISAINAIGNSIPPIFIFPRVNFKHHMLKGAPTGSVGTANPSGWSNADIFMIFLSHFVEHSHANNTNKVLLILDNHESHISVESLNYAKEKGIVMLTLPPHTSHKLQPLDRTVFGPLKKYYNTACNEWLLNNNSKPMTIYDVAECVGKSYPKAFTSQNIESGFRVTGIYPMNRNIFADHEFLSSYVTDRPIIEPSLNKHSASSKVQEDEPFNTIDEPSTSTSHQDEICTTDVSMSDTSIFLTPEEIRPFPKAAARKNSKRGGRKPGRCRILTDTPEKSEIEELANIRQQKKWPKKVQKVKRQVMSSSSEDDEPIFESDDSLQDVEFGTEEELEDNGDLNVNDFILVRLEGKKSYKHYVAQILKIKDNLEIKYFKKVGINKFICNDETEYELQNSEVVMKLPHPDITGGTERRRREMVFHMDMTCYNVE